MASAYARRNDAWLRIEFESRERALARLGMIDDRMGISVAEPNARGAQDLLGRRPGAMDVAGVEPRELRHVTAHIGPVRIEFLALQRGIENPEIGGGVGATARDPLPVSAVVGEIRVDQRVPKPALALPPVDEKVLDQKLAETIRARLCIHPVIHNSRIAASTSG